MSNFLTTEQGQTFTYSGGLGICCGENHIWLWCGDNTVDKPPEGLLCACGMMEYHTGKCKECGCDVLKPMQASLSS